ncbi:MAG: AfsR/SARP family transcriptional regulator [Gammaproteobacteria bacterium]
MSGIKATLFGRFCLERGNQRAVAVQAGKTQELLGYLLINRNHPQPRELLCEVLWGNQPQDKSKKQLRQTLWRLQSALKKTADSRDPEILADENWIQVDASAVLWLDIAEFERVSKEVSDKSTAELTAGEFASIQSAVNLYRGDLLEGWYQDWCLFERERLQVLYLIMLDKLVEYCEAHAHYETGLSYGAEILRCDRGYERAHRQMMRLYHMAGDRTQALHQNRRCVTALREELDVEPSERTKQLHEQIRSDKYRSPAVSREDTSPEAAAEPALAAALKQLKQFSKTLNQIESQVRREIQSLESTLSARE